MSFTTAILLRNAQSKDQIKNCADRAPVYRVGVLTVPTPLASHEQIVVAVLSLVISNLLSLMVYPDGWTVIYGHSNLVHGQCTPDLSKGPGLFHRQYKQVALVSPTNAQVLIQVGYIQPAPGTWGCRDGDHAQQLELLELHSHLTLGDWGKLCCYLEQGGCLLVDVYIDVH